MALEGIRGDLTVVQIISKYGVAESLVHKWKKQLLTEGSQIFERAGVSPFSNNSQDIEKLHGKIGQLTLEKDF